MKPEERKAIEQEARRLFHELWTEEVGTPGYARKEWMTFKGR
jgi:hypothetical protein